MADENKTTDTETEQTSDTQPATEQTEPSTEQTEPATEQTASAISRTEQTDNQAESQEKETESQESKSVEKTESEEKTESGEKIESEEKVEETVNSAESTTNSNTAAQETPCSNTTETSTPSSNVDTAQSKKTTESAEETSSSNTTEKLEKTDKAEESSNKRGREELEPEDKSKKAKTEDVTVLKMLCPFWCAGAVIGSKGEHIRKLKEETGCQIRITKNHENFPNTSERVVSMRGEMENIRRVILAVQNKIRTDKPPPNAPSKDNSKRKSCMKLVVSVSSAGRIIGKGGEQTKKLQSLHNVHVDVMKTADLPPGLKESVITVTGEEQGNVDNCLSDILALVSEDKRANLNYNTDYSVFTQSGPGRGKQMSHSDQFRGWGGAPNQGGWGGAPYQGGWGAGAPHSGPYPNYFPQPWGGNNHNFRDSGNSRR